MKQIEQFIAGEWVKGESTSNVVDKYDGSIIGLLHHASREQVQRATVALTKAYQREGLSSFERSKILARASELLAERSEPFVETIVREGGFPITDARREVERAAQTLTLCAEEAKRIRGEMVPIEGAPQVRNRIAFTIRRPVGVVCAITPFNSPLNTLLHKVGPALAAGNAVIVKPATYTPATATMLISLLLDAGLPPGLIALVHGEGSTVGEWLVEDPVPGFYAFTGSTPVGLRIRRLVGLRRNQLELGSIASTIVCDDADVEDAVSRCVSAAFRKAGQICTSIQRLYVHEGIYDRTVDLLVRDLSERHVGDPKDPKTFVGPLISLSDAERIEDWVQTAVDKGAEVVAGGVRNGAIIEPTLLTNVAKSARVMREEVFGPVLSVRRFRDLDWAIDEVNDTPFGLATGIFTTNLDRGLTAAMRLRVGSVHVNETSNGRLDLMPYTGVKDSGIGREGPHYAIEEMMEERLVSLRWA